MVFAQAAARDFLDLAGTRPGLRPQAGLVSFETTATADQVIAELVTGAPGSGQVQVSQFKAIVDALQPNGRTAIGVALRQAGDLFAGAAVVALDILAIAVAEAQQVVPELMRDRVARIVYFYWLSSTAVRRLKK